MAESDEHSVEHDVDIELPDEFVTLHMSIDQGRVFLWAQWMELMKDKVKVIGMPINDWDLTN